MDYADFKEVYFSIIKKSVAQLKEDRFACFVVGDVRDGFYYNLLAIQFTGRHWNGIQRNHLW
jgi:hypothetical protein